MLESVQVVNFRCFRDATVRLGALTAIVGPNASGKTALLRAVSGHGVGGIRDVRGQAPATKARIVWRQGGGQETSFVFTGDSQTGGLHGGGRYLHLDPSPMRQQLNVHEALALSPNGSNLSNVVASLPRRVQESLARELNRLIPVIEDITVRPGDTGKHRVMFQDRWTNTWYEPSDVSDGTILTLGLLTLRYQLKPATLVAIEEPEHGLHPFLLGELVTVLRRLASGDDGRMPMQIVLATQSSELLEFLEPEEVRFLTRDPNDGAVIVEEAPTGTANWREAYEEHQRSLGSLWLSGSIGGVPTS